MSSRTPSIRSGAYRDQDPTPSTRSSNLYRSRDNRSGQSSTTSRAYLRRSEQPASPESADYQPSVRSTGHTADIHTFEDDVEQEASRQRKLAELHDAGIDPQEYSLRVESEARRRNTQGYYDQPEDGRDRGRHRDRDRDRDRERDYSLLDGERDRITGERHRRFLELWRRSRVIKAGLVVGERIGHRVTPLVWDAFEVLEDIVKLRLDEIDARGGW